MIYPSSITSTLRIPNFVEHVDKYAENLQVSYDKMTLPRLGLRLDEVGDCIDSKIKVNTEISSLASGKAIEELSSKIKDISDFITVKYSSRMFKEESLSPPPAQPAANVETPKEVVKKEVPITTFP